MDAGNCTHATIANSSPDQVKLAHRVQYFGGGGGGTSILTSVQLSKLLVHTLTYTVHKKS